MDNLGFFKREEKRTEEAPEERATARSVEQDAPPPPPQSAKPPPSRPPSTYANAKPRLEIISETADKGTNNGKGELHGKPRGKHDANGVGKSTKGEKGSTATQHEEAMSEYTSYTAQEKNWGALKHQEEWGENSYGDISRWNGIRMNTSMSTTVGSMGDIQRQSTQVHA